MGWTHEQRKKNLYLIVNNSRFLILPWIQFKKLASYDLLVIDELGYLTFKPEQANAFSKLMEQRYGRKSTIITTNLDYLEWYDLFHRKPLVDALLDRLQHHCITIRIDGQSFRASAKPE
ncbi:MAG: ATP-binding protein [Mariprofundales bacterium]|nr:ATP-binding protein [Mariprofundales bacterium]